jgi:hypothetical protein
VFRVLGWFGIFLSDFLPGEASVDPWANLADSFLVNNFTEILGGLYFTLVSLGGLTLGLFWRGFSLFLVFHNRTPGSFFLDLFLDIIILAAAFDA